MCAAASRLIDAIPKPRGDVFLDELVAQLTACGATVLREAKPTFTRPAPADLRRAIAERCDEIRALARAAVDELIAAIT